jgi:hypothetical protein
MGPPVPWLVRIVIEIAFLVHWGKKPLSRLQAGRSLVMAVPTTPRVADLFFRFGADVIAAPDRGEASPRWGRAGR